MQKCGCGNDKIACGYVWYSGGWGRVGHSRGLLWVSKCNAVGKVIRWEAQGDRQCQRPGCIHLKHVSGLTSHLTNIQFFSKYLISVWSRQYIIAKLALQLFEALLLSVGISGESNCYKCSQQERERQNWSGDCCLRMKQNCIKGSPHHLHVEGEP